LKNKSKKEKGRFLFSFKSKVSSIQEPVKAL